MTTREFLIKLCEKKQELFPGIPYFLPADKVDIESWPEGICNIVADVIQEEVRKSALPSTPGPGDDKLCPWCVVYKQCSPVGCEACTYGRRHGLCDRNPSTYHEVLTQYNLPINQMPGFADIASWIWLSNVDNPLHWEWGFSQRNPATMFLIELCQKKQDKIRSKGLRFSYFNDQDARELRNWGEEVCLDIARMIKANVRRCYLPVDEYLFDGDICPWCVRFKSQCMDCTYGMRHGKCNLGASDYYKIRKRFGHTILDIPGFKAELEEWIL